MHNYIVLRAFGTYKVGKVYTSRFNFNEPDTFEVNGVNISADALVLGGFIKVVNY